MQRDSEMLHFLAVPHALPVAPCLPMPPSAREQGLLAPAKPDAYPSAPSVKGKSMKRFVTAALAAATLLCAGATASADTYLQGSGGVTFDPTQDFGCASCGVSVDTGFNVGFGLGTTLDRWFSPNWALQGDLFYTNSSYTGATCHPTEGFTHPICTAHLNSLSLMGSVIYNWHNSTDFTPYVGFGIGGVDVMVDTHTTAPPFLPNGAWTGWRFGWQAIAGVDFRVDDLFSIYGEYRYQDGGSGTVRQEGFADLHNVQYTSNNVSVGVKLHI
jgi:OOP family OmpA-OmpF porin